VEQSQERIRVLIVDDIDEVRDNLSKLLSFESDIEVVGKASSGEESIEMARQLKPHVILMDVNMPPGMDGITAASRIRDILPSIQVVMLTVQDDTEYLRRAMMAGARDYLTKPPNSNEMVNTIKRVYEKMEPVTTTVAAPAQPKAEPMGDVVAVFSPKGGVGCTTVAVNLAIALQQMIGSEKKVALMDASLQFGDVGVMLNLQANRSIADLVPRADNLDSDMLSSVLTAHGSGLKALLAPPHPEAADTLMPGSGGGPDSAFNKILSIMRRDFDITIVDMWSRIDDIALTTFDSASLIVLVAQPNIPTVKSVRLFLEVMNKIDYPLDKIALVVNCVDRHMGVKIDRIEAATIPVAVQIPMDEKVAITAANRGVPFVVRDSNRPISQSILQLTEAVGRGLGLEGGEGDEEESPEVTKVKEKGGTGILGIFDRR
jgi:pilus assembly protein CpaE